MIIIYRLTLNNNNVVFYGVNCVCCIECHVGYYSMEYQERNIQMIMDKHISTDRFVLKGYYIAITVALYGVIDREVPQHHPQHITPHHHIQNIPTVKQEPHIQPIQSHDGLLYPLFTVSVV